MRLMKSMMCVVLGLGAFSASACGSDDQSLTVAGPDGRVAEIESAAGQIAGVVMDGQLITVEWSAGEPPVSRRFDLQSGKGSEVRLATETDQFSVLGLVEDAGKAFLLGSTCDGAFDGDTCDGQEVVVLQMSDVASGWSRPEVLLANPVAKVTEMMESLQAVLIDSPDGPLVRIDAGSETTVLSYRERGWVEVDRPAGWPPGLTCATSKFLYVRSGGVGLVRIPLGQLAEGAAEKVEVSVGPNSGFGGSGCVDDGLVLAVNPPNDVNEPVKASEGLGVAVLADDSTSWSSTPVGAGEAGDRLTYNLSARQIDGAVVLDFLAQVRFDTESIREHHVLVGPKGAISEPLEPNALSTAHEIIAVGPDGQVISRSRNRKEG